MGIDMKKVKTTGVVVAVAVATGLGFGIYGKGKENGAQESQSKYGLLVMLNCVNDRSNELLDPERFLPGEEIQIPVDPEKLESPDFDKLAAMNEAINNPETMGETYIISVENAALKEPLGNAKRAAIGWYPGSSWKDPEAFNLTPLVDEMRSKACNEGPEK